MACTTLDPVNITFFVIWYMGLFFRSHELVQRCGDLECYAYVGVLKQIGDFFYFRAMVSECGPDLVVLLFGFFMTGFVLYLSVKFLNQLLWKIIVFWPLFLLFSILFVFCLGPVVQNAF